MEDQAVRGRWIREKVRNYSLWAKSHWLSSGLNDLRRLYPRLRKLGICGLYACLGQLGLYSSPVSCLAETTYTTNLSLCKPGDESYDWGACIRSNFDVIDSSLTAITTTTLAQIATSTTALSVSTASLESSKVAKIGDIMTGQLSINGSSLTIRNTGSTNTWSVLVTTASDSSSYHFRVTTTGVVELAYGITSAGSGGNTRGANAVDLQTVRTGATQVASGAKSFIGGGTTNLASGLESVVAGGNSNTASNTNSVAGGGSSNLSSGINSTVCGGNSNTASSQNSTVCGGVSNTASTGVRATIGGGDTNAASGQDSTVGGGSNNTASNTGATASGGSSNVASGVNSAVPGGAQNTASGARTFAAGNKATASGDDSVAFAMDTYNNTVASSFGAYYTAGYRLTGGGLAVSSFTSYALITANGGIQAASMTLTTDLPVSEGGSGASTFTDGGILFGNGTSAIGATGVLTNGQLLIGDGAEEPTAATLTATALETEVANGAGSITVGLPDSVAVASTLTVRGNAFSVGTSTLSASDGKVGVGTNSPATTLDVNGNAQFGSTAKSTFSAAGALTLASGAGLTMTGPLSAPTVSSTMTIRGTTDGSSAPAGTYGEYISTTPTANISLSPTGVSITIATTTLSAGEWDVQGLAYLSPGATFAGTTYSSCISLTVNDCDNTVGGFESSISAALTGVGFTAIPTYTRRINVSTPTAVYLNTRLFWTTDGGSVWLAQRTILRARRVSR